MELRSSQSKSAEAYERPFISESDGVDMVKTGGTARDRQDMWRIGRKQELNVCPLLTRIPDTRLTEA